MSKSNTVPAALLAVMVLACASAPKPGHDPLEARVVCEDFVEDRLKSPGSAEFSDQAELGEYPTFIARGSVDSENSFGASIRNKYWCKVTYKPKTDKWHLVEITGLEN